MMLMMLMVSLVSLLLLVAACVSKSMVQCLINAHDHFGDACSVYSVRVVAGALVSYNMWSCHML